ncbi:MAG: bifunctional DNA-formamidopyrimidine glycosylase/DNA-(apurinic or apyrimidinic site) lyase [Deltaproteobacteria bacterium]
MPELPEVETLKRQLKDNILDDAIEKIVFIDTNIAHFFISPNRIIKNIERIGKYLCIILDNNQQIVIHLRMSGKMLLMKNGSEISKYTRFVIKTNRWDIFCTDPRRFATINLCENFYRQAIVINPLEKFSLTKLMDFSASRKTTIKQFLLNQEVIAGIGNIYVCEILFSSSITPHRKTSSINKDEWRKIVKETRKILSLAISCRGTSISDWRDAFGNKGMYQEKLLVYGRAKQNCPKCENSIVREVIAGRGTYFCPNCQK